MRHRSRYPGVKLCVPEGTLTAAAKEALQEFDCRAWALQRLFNSKLYHNYYAKENMEFLFHTNRVPCSLKVPEGVADVFGLQVIVDTEPHGENPDWVEEQLKGDPYA